MCAAKDDRGVGCSQVAPLGCLLWALLVSAQLYGFAPGGKETLYQWEGVRGRGQAAGMGVCAKASTPSLSSRGKM